VAYRRQSAIHSFFLFVSFSPLFAVLATLCNTT
jgi:hypothetical protein